MPVQLFVTCLVNSLYPNVGKAAVTLLERAGHEVEFPVAQACCGQPAYNSGFHDEAKAQMRQTLDVLDATTGPIVLPSGSCAAMVIHHAAELVGGEPDYAAKAVRVGSRTRELTQFLVEDAEPAPEPVVCGTVTYHASCHALRELAVLDQPKALLDGAGVARVELEGEDECCGFGGLFSVKAPEVSTAMMETKIDRITSAAADVVTGVDVACLMHIGGGLRRRGSPIEVKHVAEIIAGDIE